VASIFRILPGSPIALTSDGWLDPFREILNARNKLASVMPLAREKSNVAANQIVLSQNRGHVDLVFAD